MRYPLIGGEPGDSTPVSRQTNVDGGNSFQSLYGSVRPMPITNPPSASSPQMFLADEQMTSPRAGVLGNTRVGPLVVADEHTWVRAPPPPWHLRGVGVHVKAMPKAAKALLKATESVGDKMYATFTPGGNSVTGHVTGSQLAAGAAARAGGGGPGAGAAGGVVGPGVHVPAADIPVALRAPVGRDAAGNYIAPVQASGGLGIPAGAPPGAPTTINRADALGNTDSMTAIHPVANTMRLGSLGLRNIGGGADALPLAPALSTLVLDDVDKKNTGLDKKEQHRHNTWSLFAYTRYPPVPHRGGS